MSKDILMLGALMLMITSLEATPATPSVHPVFSLESDRLLVRENNIEGFRNAGIAAGSYVLGIKFQKLSSFADLAAIDLQPGAPITVEVLTGERSTFLPVRLTSADIGLIKTVVEPKPKTSGAAEIESAEKDGPDPVKEEYLPIVKVQPAYPRRALSRGMVGWVTLEFTVTREGTVKDPVVIENCAWVKPPQAAGQCANNPNSVFDSAATKAVQKFRYKPRVVDGVAVETAGVQNTITFDLM